MLSFFHNIMIILMKAETIQSMQKGLEVNTAISFSLLVVKKKRKHGEKKEEKKKSCFSLFCCHGYRHRQESLSDTAIITL